jgi:proline dehydrogenase
MMRRGLLAASRQRWLAQAVSSNRLAWLAARRFVAGNTLAEAMAVVATLNAAGIAVSLDHLGENVTAPAEAEQASRHCLEAARQIRQSGAHAGVSVKLTSLGVGLSVDLAARLLRDVVAGAASLDPPVFVRIDMEDSALVQTTLDLFAAMFGESKNMGLVIQSYLYRSAEDVERLIRLGAGVRMVKGAYLEPPTVAYARKSDVDAQYIRLCTRLLSSEALANGVYLAIATHDPAMLAWAKQFAATQGIDRNRFEFQMLYGIRRDLQTALVAEGYRMRVYVPYGRQWYPYFMRRLAERPQNVGFLVRGVLGELRS